jgi:tetratricopeptide (TPR) repeat protein
VNDARGLALTNASAHARDRYEVALRQFQSYVGDPVATLDEALADSPDFIAAHLFRALAMFTANEKSLIPAVAASLDEAVRRQPQANERERGLTRATQCFVNGDWHAGCVALDRVLADHPRDAVALQTGHLVDFYRGDALNLRNRVSRVLPHWDASLPGYSYVLGMHAFGLEEMNQYAEAEATGRRALDLEPADGWAVHAVTHVMEMQGRIDEGVDWLTTREKDWAPDNLFAFHNFWHLALFHLDAGRYADALALYDEKIHPAPSQAVLALVDATALLWRLALDRADVGNRFDIVADEWEARLDQDRGFYAFNDVHAMLAFVATDRGDAIERLAANLTLAAASTDTNGMMSREVGLPLAQGIEAFGRGHYDAAIDLIEPVRDIAHRFGGSHAQRDLITLTLIEAALRAGRPNRARHFIAERLVHRPRGRWGLRLAERAQAVK